ncbi:hypothetical protein ACIO6T_10855 [Streptomyces sp. NPDC087532]|uniref:hypothetical protein n=1 Tax=Streptomyces sp. NPDC087532 TaxID=3365795 RepID=UPI0038162E3F
MRFPRRGPFPRLAEDEDEDESGVEVLHLLRDEATGLPGGWEKEPAKEPAFVDGRVLSSRIG